ncbi:LysE family translocator [Lactococcus garvieae]|uniref:LysE family translocator n=2 Tax=Lactococcus garvieae TaxID=1363 RepID=UPI00036363B7|nr:LysE family transporter [Lactococcus garvieae]
MKIFLKGLYFGMMLQLAIGPVCLFIFNTATTNGFFSAMQVVVAVTLIDALFIILSLFGISLILNNENIMFFFKIFSGMILIFFGINLICSVFDFPFFNNIFSIENLLSNNFFLTGLVLTVSNPLTIVFWGSFFSKQVSENNYNSIKLSFFAIGCISATFLFLIFVSVLGIYFTKFLTQDIILILNLVVGLIIALFGVKMLISRKR